MNYQKSTINQLQPIILGIDPGYGITGYAFIKELSPNSFEILAYGVITTPGEIPFIGRLKMIADDLQALIDRYHPTIAGVEELFFAKNTKTAIDVGQARGVILLKLIENNMKLVELTPLQVKQGLTGDGKADKKQVQKMVKMILDLNDVPKPDDAADALAVAIVTSQISQSSLLSGN